MKHIAWLALTIGAVNIVLTRLGWYDQGGVLRRLDWFNMYALLDRSWLGGGVRRANYAVGGVLIFVGLAALLGLVLRGQ